MYISSLICCFILQPPVEFRNLRGTSRKWIQKGALLSGICYDDNKLYCVAHEDKGGILTVYDIARAGDGDLTPLCSVDLEIAFIDCRPRIDRHTGSMYLVETPV